MFVTDGILQPWCESMQSHPLVLIPANVTIIAWYGCHAITALCGSMQSPPSVDPCNHCLVWIQTIIACPLSTACLSVKAYSFVAQITTVNSRASSGALCRRVSRASGWRRCVTRRIRPSCASTSKWTCRQRSWRCGSYIRPGAGVAATKPVQSKR